MIIYLDILLLLDFSINFIFLVFINKALKEKCHYFLLIIFSLLGSLLIIPCFYNRIYLEILKIIGGLIICLLAFFSNKKDKLIIKIALFYALNLALVGLLCSFKITKWYLLLISLNIILVMFVLENFKKYFIFIERSKYNVIINSSKKKLRGLMDNGNMSTYLGYPIVYLNQKYYQNNITLNIKIPIETVIGSKNLFGFIDDNFLIEVNDEIVKKRVVVIYADIKEDCLLNPQIFL